MLASPTAKQRCGAGQVDRQGDKRGRVHRLICCPPHSWARNEVQGASIDVRGSTDVSPGRRWRQGLVCARSQTRFPGRGRPHGVRTLRGRRPGDASNGQWAGVTQVNRQGASDTNLHLAPPRHPTGRRRRIFSDETEAARASGPRGKPEMPLAGHVWSPRAPGAWTPPPGEAQVDRGAGHVWRPIRPISQVPRQVPGQVPRCRVMTQLLAVAGS